MAWDRGTMWRQGHALEDLSAESLGLVREEEPQTEIAIVVSHDCDIVNSPSVEPTIEVIVAKRISNADGNFTHAKNPRKLHLPCEMGSTTIFLEFCATGKQGIPKSNLEDHQPSQNITLSPQSRKTLQRWLAARYHRSSFPEEFDRRLSATKLGERIRQTLKPLGGALVAVFFDVDGGTELDRSNTMDPYELRIYLLYSTEHDSAIAEADAERACEVIVSLFKEWPRVPNEHWTSIELLSCEAVSDEAMTYRQSTQLIKWNMDFVSLQTDAENSPMLTE